jgi:hypothetical protein
MTRASDGLHEGFQSSHETHICDRLYFGIVFGYFEIVFFLLSLKSRIEFWILNVNFNSIAEAVRLNFVFLSDQHICYGAGKGFFHLETNELFDMLILILGQIDSI